MLEKRKLTALLCGLSLCGFVNAQNYPYLDDVNDQPDGPVVPGNFPKIMATETQSDNASNEAWSKYDLLGTKTGMMYRVAAAQKINPQLRFHYSFHPGEYIGYLGNACEIAFGMPFNSTGPATTGCAVYAGHWLYRAGTRLSWGINNTTNIIRVPDANRLSVGEYIVIYDAPAGSFNNAEHMLVTAIDKSVSPHKVTVASRGYKSTARGHGANSIVAQHVRGSAGSNKNWAYNVATTGKRDSNNMTIAQVMVNWIPNNWNKNSKGQVQSVNVAGVYFDQDVYVLNDGQADVNNDLVPDGGILSGGNNAYALGMESFYQQLRNRIPGKRIVGGWRLTRGFDSLNGIQMENWLLAQVGNNEFSTNPQYTGFQGIYSQLHNYMIHLAYHKTAEGFTENLSKVPTKLYPGTVKTGSNPPIPASNANFRLGLATTLLGDGYYGRQNSKWHPDPWHDEYAVDVNKGSSTYGHAIKSNPQNESQIRQHKGWLGKPLGKRKRIYNATQFQASNNKLTNGGFESGKNGWVFNNLNTTLDTSDKNSGAQSLKVIGHGSYAKNVGGASLRGPEVYLVAGRQYTLAFSARSSKMREVYLRLDWGSNQGVYLVPERWTKFVYTITAAQTGKFRPVIDLGRENTQFWIDDVYVFEGDPNVFRRDFENGIVVVNATPKTKTIALGGTFQRIKGTGQDPINNGAKLTSVTIPAFDAAILVRPEAEEPPPPPPPPSTPPPSGSLPAGSGQVTLGNGTISLGGRAWNDSNGDGIRQDGESAFAGLRVKLLNCMNYQFGEVVTDSNGQYRFDGLSPSGYTVSVDLPAGTIFSPARVGAGNRDSDITVWPGETYCMKLTNGDKPLAVGIGLISEVPKSASLGNKVWRDLNKNGIQDASEWGIDGIYIQLTDCSGKIVDSTTSANGGMFNFKAAPGSYQLEFIPPPYLDFTVALKGTSRAVDSDANAVTGVTSCFNVSENENNQWYDAGFVQ